ncbi:hypothetical protein BT69DRAFT_295363 [Atractiella rhizophila]|nr:hypothetical protein BT69DRAFT_295363 [Atractiella rhizophila]
MASTSASGPSGGGGAGAALTWAERAKKSLPVNGNGSGHGSGNGALALAAGVMGTTVPASASSNAANWNVNGIGGDEREGKKKKKKRKGEMIDYSCGLFVKAIQTPNPPSHHQQQPCPLTASLQIEIPKRTLPTIFLPLLPIPNRRTLSPSHHHCPRNLPSRHRTQRRQ